MTSNPALSTFTNTLSKLGSVPVKPRYLTCHGSVSVLTLAVPFRQVDSCTVALVMYPIRVPSTLAIVLAWSVPSSVTAQVMVLPLPMNLTSLNVDLKLWAAG